MNWRAGLLGELHGRPVGYGRQSPSAEPTALAALALLAHGRHQSARPALDWLAVAQQPDGHVPLRPEPLGPPWTTALAALAWAAAARHNLPGYREPLQRALAWMLHAEGEVSEPHPQFGHDSSLVGWPWVPGTHSWLEPTALHLLALDACGWETHPRALEARRLIADRLLPGGGCNYGNTRVLGQMLRPQIQPSAMALLALGPTTQTPVRATLDYLRRSTGPQTPTTALCWALAGLAAHDRRPADADQWLRGAAERPRRDGLQAALILLASLGAAAPWRQRLEETAP